MEKPHQTAPFNSFAAHAHARIAKVGERIRKRAPRKSKAAKRAELRRRAPKHPVGIEARLRLIVAAVARAHNPHLKVAWLHRNARTDAPRARTVARKELRSTVTPLAHDMAKNVHAQVAESLGVQARDLEVDLSEQTYGFVDGLVSILEDYPVEATKHVSQAFAEWESVAEEDRTREALSALLDGALDGAESQLQTSVRLLFGNTFADMNQATQKQAGVTGYHWLSRRDGSVRPEHAELDDPDEIYEWDDPPLKADKSSNGEDDHPGDDYNCRCIAVPAIESAFGAGEDDSE